MWNGGLTWVPLAWPVQGPELAFHSRKHHTQSIKRTRTIVIRKRARTSALAEPVAPKENGYKLTHSSSYRSAPFSQKTRMFPFSNKVGNHVSQPGDYGRSAAGVAMTFAAYQARHDGSDFTFEGRDDAAGILGTFRVGDASPVVTAETLEELEHKARAHLGDEPDAFLYLTNAKAHVYRIMINKKYQATIERAARREEITVALLVFCVTCLVAASLGSLGVWALVGFVCVVGLYAITLGVGLFNEIEGALVCEILLILALLFIPALEKLRTQLHSPAVPESTSCLRMSFSRGEHHERT